MCVRCVFRLDSGMLMLWLASLTCVSRVRQVVLWVMPFVSLLRCMTYSCLGYSGATVVFFALYYVFCVVLGCYYVPEVTCVAAVE